MVEELVSPGESRLGQLSQGQQIGPYRIERLLGRGGMASVYEATHTTLERTVALKVLLPSLAGDKEFVDRFLSEARSAARLDYPHIVPIYDSGEIDGIYYIAMKLLEGPDLKAILEARRDAGTPGLPLERAVSIASQVAGALEFAHQHRVVHRDIKPGNISVDSNDRVTVVDFGIARALDSASSTVTGTVIGTPTYMSPEQAQAKPVDYRSDIYSFGVMLYEMLTGSLPFTGSPQTVMYAHVNTQPPSPQSVLPSLPAGLNEVILRALAKKPEDRYQSAGTLILALSNAVGGELAEKALSTFSGLGYDRETLAELAEDARRARPSGLSIPPKFLAGLGVGVAVVAALVIWLFTAGPIANAGGLLVVNSDPAGATVTVDGNRLGVTPLKAQALSPGMHKLVLDKTGYAPVNRDEKITSRNTDHVNAALTGLPASSLVTVTQAIIATDVHTDAGRIVYGQPVSQVQVSQKIGLVVTLAPKFPGLSDINFRYEMDLLASDGTKLIGSAPTPATVQKSEQSKSFAWTFNFNPNPDGSVPVGTYQVKFLVDNQEIASKPIELVN